MMLNRKTMDVVLIILTALLAVAKAVSETDELPASPFQME